MKPESEEIQTLFKVLTSDQKLFKIFGHESFTFEKAYAPSIADWSGFYTQLNPEHSMRYLTKKWDDGADYACLVLLQPIKDIDMIKVYNQEYFSNPRISGEEKASKLKQHLITKSHQQNSEGTFKFEQEDLLMKTLGEKQILLECIDMDQNQIIIPHDILKEKYFQYKILLSFMKSQDGLLRTVAWAKGDSFQGNQQNWHLVKGQSQYQPHLLLKQESLIFEFLSNLKLG